MQLIFFKTREFCLLVLLSLAIFNIGCYKPFQVKGDCMSHLINDNDKIFVNRSFGELKRSDVIAFRYPKDERYWYIQRIIGLPNETIEIREQKVYINGEELTENYVDSALNQKKFDVPKTKIPEDNYFVMGDYRDNSSDSRYWGTVKKELVEGVYSYTYWKASEK